MISFDSDKNPAKCILEMKRLVSERSVTCSSFHTL